VPALPSSRGGRGAWPLAMLISATLTPQQDNTAAFAPATADTSPLEASQRSALSETPQYCITKCKVIIPETCIT
jgi:hypothetical protein